MNDDAGIVVMGAVLANGTGTVSAGFRVKRGRGQRRNRRNVARGRPAWLDVAWLAEVLWSAFGELAVRYAVRLAAELDEIPVDVGGEL